MRPTTRSQPAVTAPRVAVYARYSSDMQQPVSIERQVRTCRDYATRQGWGAIPDRAIYADQAVSGSTTARAAYQRLKQEIAGSNGSRPYDVILIEDLSRLMRDMGETEHLFKMAPIWGIRIIGVSDGVDTSRKGAKQFAYLKGIMAEGYLDELKERIRGGLRERFLAGHHAGGTCYGYITTPLLDPSGKKDRFGNPVVLGRRLAIDRKPALVLRRIFKEAAAGMTPREIAAGLDHDRVPKPCATYAFGERGKARLTSQWNPSTVFSLLRNARYIGEWTWRKKTNIGVHPETKKKTIQRTAADEVVRQVRPDLAIIDKKTWDKVQAHLARRAMGVRHDPVTGRLQGRAPGCAPTRDNTATPGRGS